MATINGTAGNDSLVGTSGDDTLNGFGGSDTLVGSGGIDRYDGGSASDTLDLRATAASVVVDFAAGTINGGFHGTFLNMERVLGGNGHDSIIGASGAQNLSGRTGNDTLAGATGVDTLWGGAGNDRFIFREFGAADADQVSDFTSGQDKLELDAVTFAAIGGEGNFNAGDPRFAANASGTAQDASDRVIFETDTRQVWYDADGNGSAARQLIATLQSGATLTAADIVVVTGPGGAVITGTPGDDMLEGTPGDDTIDGLGGNDTLRGWEGADSLRGGDGNDVLYAYHHALILDNSDSAADTLDGGLGDDEYYVGEAADIILDAGGIDTVIAGTDWTLGAGLENLEMDALASDGTGNELDNRIVGSAEHGSIFGMGGNDTLIIIGETGQARGGDGDDTLSVDSGSQGLGYALFGDAGDDLLTSGDEDTTMDGGAGNDTLDGAPGTYAFAVAPGAANADLILGFSSGANLLLDGAVHASSGPSGRFASDDARFAANATGTAQDTTDRVVYHTGSGQLWYDTDGNGSGAAQLIATLEGAPTLVAGDISIINGSAGGSVINGTEGDDSLLGTPGNDSIAGLGGNDTLHGADGEDRLDGGTGNDSLSGGVGADLMVGGDGNDTLNGQALFDGTDNEEPFADTMDGGLGDDWYEVAHADDVVVDAGGIDMVVAHDMPWTLGAGFENLLIKNDISESGFSGIGNELDNRIGASYAGSRLEGRGGNDTLFGAGGQGSNELFGGDGDDSLVGATDEDVLDGGAGNDTLAGSGDATYVFAVAPGSANADRISGLASGALIELDGSVHANSGISGRFAAGDARFAAGAGFTSGQDASDRVVYNTATGQLFYDADGSGAGAAQLIATLEEAPTLGAHTISIANGDADGLAITGTSGNDSLVGSTGNDTIDGLAGNDTIRGVGGRDLLIGGDGNDTLIREDAGEDFLDEHFLDTLNGGLGDDVYDVYALNRSHADLPNATIIDSGGVDTVLATIWTLGDGLENLVLVDRPSPGYSGVGNELDNVMRTASKASASSHGLSGRGGNDTLIGNAGGDGLDGGAGDDWLEGGVDGGAEFDRLIGGAGRDSFVFREATPGGPIMDDAVNDFISGVDRIVLDAHAMSALGASGSFTAADARFWSSTAGAAHDADDRVIYNTATGDLWYDADGNGTNAALRIATLEGTPFLAASDVSVINGSSGGSVINGTSANDTLSGTAGDDTINGLGGNDLFLAGSTGGADVIDGGDGRDSIEFKAAATSAIVVNFNAGTITGGSAGGSISFSGIERVVGGNFDDSMSGTIGSQNLTGQAGADTLSGGAGNDTLWGGTGNDAFVFNGMGSANADRISDFASGQDQVQLEDTAFTAIGAMGDFAAGDARFWASGTGAAHDANDRVTYNTSTGQLYYDADGNGGGGAQLIATLTTIPAIAATDIAVI